MADCEFHKEYVEYLNGRISAELVPDGFPANMSYSQVWKVLQNAAICGSLGNISPEEESLVINTIFCLYPQFEERLKTDLTKKHLA